MRNDENEFLNKNENSDNDYQKDEENLLSQDNKDQFSSPGYNPIQNNTYDPFRAQDFPPPQMMPERKEKKRSMAAPIVATIIACSVFSAAFGFGGGYLANQMTQNTNTAAAENKIIYQSVVRNTSSTSTNTETVQNALSIPEIVSMNENSVVEITTETVTTGSRMQQYVATGAGSGVIITADGYIVTNNHVIEGASKISVRLKNGQKYDAKLIGTDAKTDIAVVKIEASDLKPNVYGDSSKLQVGELAVAIGNPLGELGGTVTNGIISALDREITIDGQSMTLLQTNAEINPGNSGGGLFDQYGELIGIVNAKSSGSDVEGLGFAIPINTAKSIIEQLISYGYVKGRITLGLTLVDITDDQTAMRYRVSQLGTYVQKVTIGSNAANAGFAPGDCILSADGTAISNSNDLKSFIDKHSVGDTVSFEVLRSSKKVTLTLTLQEEKPA